MFGTWHLKVSDTALYDQAKQKVNLLPSFELSLLRGAKELHLRLDCRDIY
jgi:hypothetical protein